MQLDIIFGNRKKLYLESFL